MQFSSLDLSKSLLGVVASRGYTTPTPIQAQAIPPILEGHDLLGCAQTGTGKTAAFALPILDLLGNAKGHKERGRRRLPRALVLSPTRELACQIEDSFRVYGERSRLRQAVIYGGVKQHRQVQQLQNGVDIIVATPGRLMDLMQQGHVNLSGIEIFVLDEADQMLDMGFIDPIRQIAGEIPSEHQTLLFSATMPANIRRLADSLLNDPVRITVTPVASAAPNIEQQLYMVPGEHKPSLLNHLLEDESVKRALVFTRTKHAADKLSKKLAKSGIRADSIHGNKSQNQRQKALHAFRQGKARVLVATDVAARGLDVDGITHVINFNLPNEPEAYVHRIGRTGRAGASGIAVSFCAHDERKHLRSIERLTGKQLQATPLPEGIKERTAEDAKSGGGYTEDRPRPERSERPSRRPYPQRSERSSQGGYRGNGEGGSGGGGYGSGYGGDPRETGGYRGKPSGQYFGKSNNKAQGNGSGKPSGKYKTRSQEGQGSQEFSEPYGGGGNSAGGNSYGTSNGNGYGSGYGGGNSDRQPRRDEEGGNLTPKPKRKPRRKANDGSTGGGGYNNGGNGSGGQGGQSGGGTSRTTPRRPKKAAGHAQAARVRKSRTR